MQLETKIIRAQVLDYRTSLNSIKKRSSITKKFFLAILKLVDNEPKIGSKNREEKRTEQFCLFINW